VIFGFEGLRVEGYFGPFFWVSSCGQFFVGSFVGSCVFSGLRVLELSFFFCPCVYFLCT
jgi:hypothetical protein